MRDTESSGARARRRTTSPSQPMILSHFRMALPMCGRPRSTGRRSSVTSVVPRASWWAVILLRARGEVPVTVSASIGRASST